MTYTVRNDIIRHESFNTALSKLEALHRRSKSTGFAEGLFITAPSGAGKTTLINYYVEKNPGVDESDRTTIPVLVVETPSAPTAKSLAERMQLALTGNIVRGTTEFQTNRIFTLIKELKVELLIVDEIQHFVDRKHVAETVRVTDWLKSLINKAKIPVALFGLPRSVEILKLNEQLRRRFSSKYFMRPFGFSDADQQKNFRAVLKILEEGLPCQCRPPMHEFDMSRRLLYASNGLFDYLAKILDGAVEYAMANNQEAVGLTEFQNAFIDRVWNEAPCELNPFSNDFVFRRLDKPGEPFADAAINLSKVAA